MKSAKNKKRYIWAAGLLAGLWMLPLPIIAPQPEPPPVHRVKMAVVGDLMLHEWQFDDAYDPATGEFDFNYTFEDVKKYLEPPDFTIGNLETTFSGEERGYGFYPLFNAPDSFGAAIKNAGFDFLSTANNHTNDKREGGILRTLDVLDRLGLDYTGSFRSQEDRDTICIREINGITFAFLAYSYSTNGIPLTPGKPWLLNLLDEALIISDIQAAKALEPDFIVILPHMGVEYAVTPNAASRRIVRIMFEAGADFVFASHPHVLQPMEFIEITDGDGTLRNCFVHYSLGNFISSQRTLPREQSIILNLYFEKTEGEKASLRSASYIPTWVKFRDAGGRQNIKVLPVHDTVSAMDRGLDVDLRPHDRAHVRTVLRSITAMYGGQLCVCEEHASEYFIATPYGRLPCLDVLFDAATTPLS